MVATQLLPRRNPSSSSGGGITQGSPFGGGGGSLWTTYMARAGLSAPRDEGLAQGEVETTPLPVPQPVETAAVPPAPAPLVAPQVVPRRTFAPGVTPQRQAPPPFVPVRQWPSRVGNQPSSSFMPPYRTLAAMPVVPFRTQPVVPPTWSAKASSAESEVSVPSPPPPIKGKDLDPPVYDGKSMTWREFLRRTSLWQRNTALPVARQGNRLLQALSGGAWEHCEVLRPVDLEEDDGVSRVISHLALRFEAVETQRVGQILDEFFSRFCRSHRQELAD